MKKTTGPDRFLLWAGPCRGNNMHQGKISPEDYLLCDRFLREGGPEGELVALIERCFPRANKARLAFAEEHGFADSWDDGCVNAFWQQHTSPFEDCCSRVGTVDKILSEMVVSLRMHISGKLVNVVNQFGLPLEDGRSFWTHNCTLIQPA